MRLVMEAKIPKSAAVNTRTDPPTSAIVEQPPLPALPKLSMDAPVSSLAAMVRRGRLSA
jgi:hypothetical protein